MLDSARREEARLSKHHLSVVVITQVESVDFCRNIAGIVNHFQSRLKTSLKHMPLPIFSRGLLEAIVAILLLFIINSLVGRFTHKRIYETIRKWRCCAARP